jgi:hypothetical protein
VTRLRLLKRDDGRVLILPPGADDPRDALAIWHSDGRLVEVGRGRTAVTRNAAEALRVVGMWAADRPEPPP